jgi:hypothetical protein
MRCQHSMKHEVLGMNAAEIGQAFDIGQQRIDKIFATPISWTS